MKLDDKLPAHSQIGQLSISFGYGLYIFYHRMDQEELIYEEEEVVWAKIRGYPWWPAFISQIHQNQQDEMEYTVVFFGDNTNSRLDGSKLRKFIDNYIDCFSKAKTHRKLMMSIMMAEDKLRQNDQNVQIFEEMRGRIKNKKGKSTTKDNLQSSEHVSEQGEFKNKKKPNENQIYEEPEESEKQATKKQTKIKNKPIPKQKSHNKKKSKKKVEMSEESIQEEEVQSEMKAEREAVDLEKQCQQKKKERQQLFVKKAAVSVRTLEIAIEVKNGEIIERKQSEVIMKVQQQQPIEKPKPQLRQQNSKKKEQQEQKQMSEEMHADQTTKKKRGRKSKNEKQAMLVTGQEQNSQKKQPQSNSKSKQQDEVKKNKNHKDLQLPNLQKHATQPLPEKEESEMVDEASQQINNEDSQSLSSQFMKVKRKGRSSSTGQLLNTSSRPIVFPRKRGRPKKIDIVRQIDQDADSQKQDRNENIPSFKKKNIRKMILTSKQPQRPKQKSIADQAVINGVKRLLHNRKALIEFLLQSTITVDNVKQILDMDVSNILQEGVVNEQVIYLLDLFRAALLYKYFPDDVKHRKKYQKLLKKKHFQQDREYVEDRVEQLPQIRKKTINKLKKFLGTIDEQSKVNQISQRIEANIYYSDGDMGTQYCRIAYQVLSALKQKRQNYQQIIGRLEMRMYD